MTRANVFFGGVPVQPDVKRLLDHFGRPVAGQRFPYEEICNVLQLDRSRTRWTTVTNAWRKTVYSLYNVLIGCVPGEAFIALNESERLSAGVGKYKSGIRCVRKAYVTVSGCDSAKLSEEEKNRQVHATGVMGHLLLHDRIEARRLLTTKA